MKIILINPPSPFLIDQKSFSPLGLLYLAAVLEKNKEIESKEYEVEVIDLAGMENELEKALIYCDADIYGITSTTSQYLYAKKIKDILKNSNMESKIIIGGAHASSSPERCIIDGFDHVVVGEGENAILKIVRSYNRENGIENNQVGEIENIVHCQYIKNLDTIPFPARHLIDVKSYGYDIGEKATTIITSRGCPFNCAFCSKDVWQSGVRYHSPEYVVKELEEIISNYNFKYFLFLDDSMTINKKRLSKICDLIKPLDIKWRCYARAKGTNKKVLQMMKDAGCIEIGMGIESGSKRILDIVNKGTDPEQNLQFVKDCKEIGIVANAFIMIGLPGENRKTVEETKKWMEKALPDKFGFNIFMPYIGTPIYKSCIDYDKNEYDINIYNIPEEDSWVKGRQGDYKSFVSTKGLGRDEILKLFYEHFEYYSNLIKWKPGIGYINN